MTLQLRPYQSRAVAVVNQAWQTGVSSVCLVAPCGAGKTLLANTLLREHTGPAVFVAHRRELVVQAATRLRQSFGASDVGVIMPGYDRQPHARIQVASIQTLLARKHRPPGTLLVWDEAHHVMAEAYRPIAADYKGARIVGLTATPQRQDGSPLGDLFRGLVVAAQYSELLRDGFLVPCRVLRPPEFMGSDLAADPLKTYQRHGASGQCFAFLGSVKLAHKLSNSMTAVGIPAETITATTHQRDRNDVFARFRAGTTRVICNVGVLTEGVDVPSASVCLLARQCMHVGLYLQIVGRVLRPAPGKTEAILIDLPGATIAHGLPTEDRHYSLEGEGIRRTSPEPLRNCPQCGACIPSVRPVCPECGYVFPKEERKGPKIWDLELAEVYAGAQTPADAKRREYERLRKLGRERGWSLYFVQKQYRELFGVVPVLHDATHEEKVAEYQRLLKVQQAKGFKPGFVAVRFRDTFGRWPSKEVTG